MKAERILPNMANNHVPHPYCLPKKFTKKDLHGRVRTGFLSYSDLDRFKKFYINVFGWDMFELPESAGGMPQGSKTPKLICATGSSSETWEGAVPGHITCVAIPDLTGENETALMLEVHMDVPLSQTISEIEKHGGKLLDILPIEENSWSTYTRVSDPAGNILRLWKCPSSRTWSEPETEYDKE